MSEREPELPRPQLPSDPQLPPNFQLPPNPYPIPYWQGPPPAPVSWVPPKKPPRPSPHWVPPVVIAVVGCLVLAALFIGDHVGRPAPSRVTAFLAADGTSWYGERQASRPAGITTAGTVTESSVVDGTAIAGAVDFQLGGSILGETGTGSAARSRFWRTTTSTVNTPVARDTQVYRVDADLVLVGESGPEISYIYSPGLVELPSGVASDTSWASSGSAGAGIAYRSDFRATAAPQDCLQVTGTITYAGANLRLTRDVSKTWCPGQGVTALTERTGDRETGWSRTARASIQVPSTAEPPASWTPKTWQPHELLSTSIDPIAGRSPMSGSPSSAVSPVFTASNVLVRAGLSGQDLIGFSPGSGADWALRWRAHPGGTVLTVSAFGDVLVTTTSDRHVVAYTDQGVRLWALDLDEIVLRTPVRAGAGDLALVTLGGEVLVVQAGSGDIRWRSQPGADVGVVPVVSDGVLTIADRSGKLIGLAVSTGAELWHDNDSAAQFQAAIGPVLAVVSDGDVYGVDIHTGRRLWRASYVGIERGLVSFGNWVVLSHVGGSTAYDAVGRRVWDQAGVHAVTPGGQFLVRWDRVTADVVDQTGAVVTSFDTPEATAGNTHQFAAGPAGIYQLDSTWRFRGWTRD